jgi:hypothetical protein
MKTLTPEKVVEQCTGCKHLKDEVFCDAYMNPSMKWRLGNCPLASHIRKIVEEEVKVATQKTTMKANKKKRK